MNTISKEMIITTMKSFSKERYEKNEILKELFLLQKETVDYVFGEAATEDLRVYHAEHRLAQISEELGNVAEEEMELFTIQSKMLENEIRKVISGNKGEVKTFWELAKIKYKHKIIKNIELSDDGIKTEIDALVITNKGLHIVEVKNTKRNVFIDEEGQYYRTGRYLRMDSHIAEKINRKEYLLKKTLENTQYVGLPILTTVVFTNNSIEVENNYPGIKTCFLNQLSRIIEENKGEVVLDDDEIEDVYNLIDRAEIRCEYSCDFDVESYKEALANLLVKLENARNRRFYEVIVSNFVCKFKELFPMKKLVRRI